MRLGVDAKWGCKMKNLMIVTLALLLGACGQNASEPVKNEVAAKQLAPSKSGPASAAEGAVFTDYAPQFPGSETLDKSLKVYDDFSSTEFHMTTSASVADVSKFYREKLAGTETMPVTYDYSTPEKLDIMAGDFVGGVEGKTKTNLGTSLSAEVKDRKTHIYLMLNNPK
jgi:hypothetical protein